MYEKQESWNQDVCYRPWRRLLSFLSGWWISERFVDFGYFHFCLLDSTNLGLILILSKKKKNGKVPTNFKRDSLSSQIL